MRFQSFGGSVTVCFDFHKYFSALHPSFCETEGQRWLELCNFPFITLDKALEKSSPFLCRFFFWRDHSGFLSKWLPFPWVHFQMVTFSLPQPNRKGFFSDLHQEISVGSLQIKTHQNMWSFPKLGTQAFSPLKLIHPQLAIIH